MRFWSRTDLHPAANAHLLADVRGELADQGARHGRNPIWMAASPASSRVGFSLGRPSRHATAERFAIAGQRGELFPRGRETTICSEAISSTAIVTTRSATLTSCPLTSR